MAKPKKDRAKGKKAVGDLAAKDVATTEAQAVSGGKVTVHDISIVKVTDKASPSF
jgi:type VI protein secretion system component Hcp